MCKLKLTLGYGIQMLIASQSEAVSFANTPCGDHCIMCKHTPPNQFSPYLKAILHPFGAHEPYPSPAPKPKYHPLSRIFLVEKYHSTLAASTLIILFSEMSKFSPKKIPNSKTLRRKVLNFQGIFCLSKYEIFKIN